jgi:hypothetical protein
VSRSDTLRRVPFKTRILLGNDTFGRDYISDRLFRPSSHFLYGFLIKVFLNFEQEVAITEERGRFSRNILVMCPSIRVVVVLQISQSLH